MPKLWQRCVTSLSVSSKVPSSSRNSTRSRADILPSLCCRSRRCAPPPSWAIWSRFFSSAIFSSSFIGSHYRRAVLVWGRGFARPSLRRDSRPRLSKPSEARQLSVATATLASSPCDVGEDLCSRGRSVKQIQKLYFLFRRQKRRLKRIARQFPQVFVGEAERLLNKSVLLGQRGTKHGRIVGVEGQHQSLIKVAPHRMLRQFGAATRPQIAGHADFNRNLVLSQLFDQFRIQPGGKAVTDAFRLEVQRPPDGFRPGAFTGVGGEMKAVLGGASVHRREPLRRPSKLVSANAESDYIAVAKLDGEIEHALRFLGAKLPDGIEDPHERYAEIFLAALAAAFQPLENRREILLAPEADADRNHHLRMKDVLRLQPLHQPVSDQLVVFRGAQVAGNILESHEEAREVLKVVELLDFGERGPFHPVTLAQFEQRGRLDRAFEMQMELGLGGRKGGCVGCAGIHNRKVKS